MRGVKFHIKRRLLVLVSQVRLAFLGGKLTGVMGIAWFVEGTMWGFFVQEALSNSREGAHSFVWDNRVLAAQTNYHVTRVVSWIGLSHKNVWHIFFQIFSTY